jgi:hypothetical protein
MLLWLNSAVSEDQKRIDPPTTMWATYSVEADWRASHPMYVSALSLRCTQQRVQRIIRHTSGFTGGLAKNLLAGSIPPARSWGQHFFQWKTPEYWAIVDRQEETNLHNTHPAFEQWPRAIRQLARRVKKKGKTRQAARARALVGCTTMLPLSPRTISSSASLKFCMRTVP